MQLDPIKQAMWMRRVESRLNGFFISTVIGLGIIIGLLVAR